MVVRREILEILRFKPPFHMMPENIGMTVGQVYGANHFVTGAYKLAHHELIVGSQSEVNGFHVVGKFGRIGEGQGETMMKGVNEARPHGS